MSASPDVKSKRIMKSCRQCGKQVPTATKSCSCGFCFRKTSPADSPEACEGLGVPLAQLEGASAKHQRRTGRTRRERPHFFDSLEYGTHVRKRRNLSASVMQGGGGVGGIRRKGAWQSPPRQPNKATGLICSPSHWRSVGGTLSPVVTGTLSPSPSSVGGTAAGGVGATVGANGTSAASSSSSAEEDLYAELTAERVLRYSLVLAEINRKCAGVSCQPG